MRSPILAVLAALTVAPAADAAQASMLQVDLMPATTNPPSPQMGDRLDFRTSIRNTGTVPVDGMIAWISLVQVNQGHEQPVDLEDWSAHKAVALAALPGGQAVETEWPMRLIAAGDYRIVVSAVSRSGDALTPSRFVDLTVRAKPVIESTRVLPVALGIPLLIGATLLARRRKS